MTDLNTGIRLLKSIKCQELRLGKLVDHLNKKLTLSDQDQIEKSKNKVKNALAELNETKKNYCIWHEKNYSNKNFNYGNTTTLQRQRQSV